MRFSRFKCAEFVQLDRCGRHRAIAATFPIPPVTKLARSHPASPRPCFVTENCIIGVLCEAQRGIVLRTLATCTASRFSHGRQSRRILDAYLTDRDRNPYPTKNQITLPKRTSLILWWMLLIAATAVVSAVTSSRVTPGGMLTSMAGHLTFAVGIALMPWIVYLLFRKPLNTVQMMSTITVGWLILAVANLFAHT